ncbi:MAG: GGDEF domain-containing protein, partial [Proteobacteria bacterium]|nr:GGDEF domain-containing protein [Pseudomonadota bacterium]
GDEYLKAIASLLKTVFRRTTDITARYGGEEFVILMVEESCENAIQLSETMRELTQAFCMEYEGQAILATISMGIATCIPRQSEKKEVLISKADKALYQSKANGRNQVTNSDD